MTGEAGQINIRKTSPASSGKWCCLNCNYADFDKCNLMTEQVKRGGLVKGMAIVVFSESLHRWRKAMIIAVQPHNGNRKAIHVQVCLYKE